MCGQTRPQEFGVHSHHGHASGGNPSVRGEQPGPEFHVNGFAGDSS